MATVSRALRDQPGVRPEVRDHVCEVALRLGYRRNLLAKNLVEGRTNAVGLVIPASGANPYYAGLTDAVRACCRARGLEVLAVHYEWDHADIRRAVRSLDERRMDAILVCSSHSFWRDSLSGHSAPHAPTAVLDMGAAVESAPEDAFDHKGGRLATEHLLDLGHERIAFLCHERSAPAADGRDGGYMAAMRDRSLEPWLVSGWGHMESGHRAMSGLLDAGEKPSAVFAHNDIAALGALRAIADHGLRCPEDVSVVGYDNTELSLYCVPSLTTVDTRGAEMARLIAERVLEAVDAGVSLDPEPVRLEPALIVRGSTAPSAGPDAGACSDGAGSAPDA